MSRTRVLTTVGTILAAGAAFWTGTQASSWQARLTTAQTNDPLSSVALAELPVRLTQSASIRPTGQMKSFELTAQRATWELVPGVTTQAVTYNGIVPGPTIRITEGDTLRVTLKNELDRETSIHWHGLHVPNAMDGVPGVTQPGIKPGESFTYEFVASHAGTFMYHPHLNSVAQIDNGLYGLLIIDPQTPDPTRFDKEFTMMLGAWQLATPGGGIGGPGGPGMMPGMDRMSGAGGMNPDQMGQMMQELVAAGPSDERVQQMAQRLGVTPEQMIEHLKGMLEMGMNAPGGASSMSGRGMMPGTAGTGMAGAGQGMNMNYNYFTINGKAYPATEPWTVQEGDLVRVRIVNISNLAHPMHLHGQDFKVVAKDGETLKDQWVGNTLGMDPGETYDIVILANNPGTWVFHCHELHHTENNGAEPGGLIQLIQYAGVPAPSLGTSAPAAQPAPATPGTGSSPAPAATPDPHGH